MSTETNTSTFTAHTLTEVYDKLYEFGYRVYIKYEHRDLYIISREILEQNSRGFVVRITIENKDGILTVTQTDDTKYWCRSKSDQIIINGFGTDELTREAFIDMLRLWPEISLAFTPIAMANNTFNISDRNSDRNSVEGDKNGKNGRDAKGNKNDSDNASNNVCNNANDNVRNNVRNNELHPMRHLPEKLNFINKNPEFKQYQPAMIPMRDCQNPRAGACVNIKMNPMGEQPKLHEKVRRAFKDAKRVHNDAECIHYDAKYVHNDAECIHYDAKYVHNDAKRNYKVNPENVLCDDAAVHPAQQQGLRRRIAINRDPETHVLNVPTCVAQHNNLINAQHDDQCTDPRNAPCVNQSIDPRNAQHQFGDTVETTRRLRGFSRLM